MSETEQLWRPRGWVGAAEVVDAFKQELDADVGGDSIGAINPPVRHKPSFVDTSNSLVGFAILVRPDQFIAWTGEDVPADPGAILSDIAGGGGGGASYSPAPSPPRSAPPRSGPRGE